MMVSKLPRSRRSTFRSVSFRVRRARVIVRMHERSSAAMIGVARCGSRRRTDANRCIGIQTMEQVLGEVAVASPVPDAAHRDLRGHRRPVGARRGLRRPRPILSASDGEEIAIRIALGAKRWEIVWLVTRRGVAPGIGGCHVRPRRIGCPVPRPQGHAVRCQRTGSSDLRPRPTPAPRSRDRRIVSAGMAGDAPVGDHRVAR